MAFVTWFNPHSNLGRSSCSPARVTEDTAGAESSDRPSLHAHHALSPSAEPRPGLGGHMWHVHPVCVTSEPLLLMSMLRGLGVEGAHVITMMPPHPHGKGRQPEPTGHLCGQGSAGVRLTACPPRHFLS